MRSFCHLPVPYRECLSGFVNCKRMFLFRPFMVCQFVSFRHVGQLLTETQTVNWANSLKLLFLQKSKWCLWKCNLLFQIDHHQRQYNHYIPSGLCQRKRYNEENPHSLDIFNLENWDALCLPTWSICSGKNTWPHSVVIRAFLVFYHIFDIFFTIFRSSFSNFLYCLW